MIYYKKKAQQDVGATAIEYGVLSALIAVATITGLQLTGVKLDRTYCIVASTLGEAVGAGGGGCSGSSSNSANKSASSANGSSSDSSANASADSSSDASDSSSSSDSSNSADSSSDADSSSPGPVIYNASNSYSMRDENGPDDGNQYLKILESAAQHGITTMSGLYDQYGNEITTPSQLASMFGVESEYENYQKTMDAFEKYPSQANRTAELNARSSLYNDAGYYYQSHQNSSTLYSPQIFLNNPSEVSFSGTDASSGKNFTTTYTKHADNYGYSPDAANFDTGVNAGQIGLSNFQLAFDAPQK